MNRVILISLILSLPMHQTLSQEIYTLEKCKEMALENNASARNAIYQLEGCKQTQKEAFTKYFPSLSASGIGFKAKDPMLSATIDARRLNLLEDGLAGAVTLTQPVFMGGRIILSNQLARLHVEMAKQQIRLTNNELLYKVESLYWNLITFYEKGKTLDILEEQLKSLLKDVQLGYDAGLITRNEVLQVQLKLNEIRINRANLDNNTQLYRMTLCQTIGIGAESSGTISIERPDSETITNPADIYINHRSALASRAEHILLEQNVRASKLQTKSKRAHYLPTIGIGASYYKNNLMDHWEGNGMAFISVSIPLSGWWGGSYQMKKQKMNEQIAIHEQTDGQEKLLLQMQSIRNELDNAYKQIHIARESVEQATENLRLNNEYYKTGMVNLTDVLDAQAFLQQNRDGYTEMYSNYRKKLFEYLQVTGR